MSCTSRCGLWCRMWPAIVSRVGGFIKCVKYWLLGVTVLYSVL